MNFSDRFSLSLHQRVAEKLRADPAQVLSVANENLDRWLSKNGFASGPERRALLEWKAILEGSSTFEIESIITADNDEGQRLRSSSPFAGVLSENEQTVTWNECAEIGLD